MRKNLVHLNNIQGMKNIALNNKVHRIHFLQDFNVPVQSVFSFFSDHNRLSEIYPALIKRIVDSPNPTNCNDVGSAIIIVSLPLVFQETITKYIENKYIEYKITTPSPLKNHIGKMNFIALDDTSSRLDYVIEFEALIPYSGFFIQQINTKLVQNALSNLERKFRENINY
jgi:hypothetical protein